MKKCFLMKFRSLCLPILILWTVTFLIPTVPAFAQDKEPSDPCLVLLREGKCIAAGKSLILSGTGSIREKSRAYRAIINYLKPDWYPEDLAELKKEKQTACPIIIDIIKAEEPKKATASQKEWLISSKVKLVGALVKMDYRQGATTFIQLLNTGDVRVRSAIIDALKTLKSKEAALPLYEYLKREHFSRATSREELMREAAMEEMARMKVVEAIVTIDSDELLPQLEKDCWNLGSPDRKIAATILTGMHRASLKETYVKLLGDSDNEIAVFAASTLKDMGDGQGFETLKRIFAKGNPTQKLWLFRIMSRWENEEAAKFFLEYLDTESKKGAFGFVPLPNMGKVPLLSTISDPNVQLVVEMMQTLIAWKKITPPLLKSIIETNNGNLRYIAAEILGETLAPEGRHVFRNMAGSTDPLLAYYGIWGLGRLEDKESKSLVLAQLKHKNERIRAAACWALAKTGQKEGYPVALKLASSKDPVVNATAFETLRLYRNKASLPVTGQFIANCNGDSTLQRLAVVFAGVMGDSAVDSSITNLSGEKGINAYYAAQSMYRLTGSPAEFSTRYVLPQDEFFYGKSPYSDAEFLRELLLYFSIKPEYSDIIMPVDLAYIKKVPYYGEFGKITTESPTNPLRKEPVDSSPVSVSLTTGEAVYVLEYRGRYAHVVTLDGRNGWVYSAGLEPINNSLLFTRKRLQADFGYRWPDELITLLEQNNLADADVKVRYSNQARGAAADLFSLVFGIAGEWIGWEKCRYAGMSVLETRMDVMRIISVKTRHPEKTFEFSLSLTGEPQKIIVK